MQIAEFLCGLSQEQLVAALKSCCNNNAWIHGMRQEVTPNLSDTELVRLSENIFMHLPKEEWLATFATHPRIGDRPTDHQRQESKEQAGITTSSESTKSKMATLNQRYREKFGFIFITCASGKTGDQMLAEIEQRIQLLKEDELRAAALEQTKITALRLMSL